MADRARLASVSRLYALLALAYGGATLVASVFWRQLPWPFLQSDSATGVAFVVSAAIAIPFIITYTQLGLNSAEGELASLATRSRHETLKRECPLWAKAWNLGLAFVGVSWVIAVLSGAVHPFFAFSAAVSCLTGIWFLFAYPVARRLFGS